MPRTRQRASARRDLVEQFVYLAENAGMETAERFLANVEASYSELAAQPMIGAPLTLSHPELVSVRKWRVKDFENYLIFYQPRSDGISVLRVIHGARDWWRILGIEG